MLTLTFLGVGNAFAKRNFQSNVLIEAWRQGPNRQVRPNETLLVDFGTTGPLALYKLMKRNGFEYLEHRGRIFYSAINNVFITHAHSDHVGGMEELAIQSLTQRETLSANGHAAVGKPKLFGTAEFLAGLWTHTLSGGLGSISGGNGKLNDYFDLVPLDLQAPKDIRNFCLLGRYEFRPVPTDHVRLEKPYDWPSFGLLIKDLQTEETVFFSGDTRCDPPRIGPLLERSKLNFHEVQLEDESAPVHTLLCELQSLPQEVKRRTLLYHFSDHWDSPEYAGVCSEFMGFAEPFKRYSLM